MLGTSFARAGAWVGIAVAAATLGACRTGSFASGRSAYFAKSSCAAPSPCATPTPPPCACPAPAPCSPGPTVNRVACGDVLHGHLYPAQGCECFYFDGVEYGLLDVELKTDVGNEAAPTLTIYDPDDRVIPLPEGYGPTGSSCLRGGGIVLPKTGTYRATVCKTPCQPEHYWSFRHSICVLSPGEQRMALTACTPKTASFTALCGSRCLISVRPEKGCGVRPRVKAIRDPEGGRALDASCVPEGYGPPTLVRGSDDSVTVDFAAPKAGRYTLEVVAEEGSAGDVTTLISVMPPSAPRRNLYHDGRPCPERAETPSVPKTMEPTANR